MNDRGPTGATLTPGTTLVGRYRIVGVVGIGGMATVYRATDTQSGTDVALKLLLPELAAMIGAERFAREVRITATLKHPHIIPILDSGTHENIPFYVMPLIEGETLDQRLSREQMMGVDEAVRIVTDVADALSYAHEQGFVHRDVKPQNILISGRHVWLADFGIARATTLSGSDVITESGIAMGTAKYMSPEQAAGGTADARSDVYSLGCVLYELLAGTPPFTGPTQAVIARHALDTAPSLLSIRPSVTPALDSAVQRALAKVPGDRYPTAHDFALAVAAAKTDTTPKSVPTTPTDAPRSRRGLLVAAAVIVVALGAGWLVTRKDPVLDPKRVVVFPLAVPTGTSIPASTGEDVATIIGNALGATSELRWVDGWTALPPKDRGQMRELGTPALRAAARERRAGYMLFGRLSVLGDSTSVALSLWDVAGDSLIVGRSESGGAKEPWRQALRALNGLMPKLIPNSARDVQTDWLGRPPAAVADFLLGEAAFRRADPGTALGHYAQALHADSSFALAAFRGAQAASWQHEAARGMALLDSVAGVALPPKSAAFAAGLRAYLSGDADSAVSKFKQAITLDPEFQEAWTQLGETYTHLLPSTGTSDALVDTAFSTAHRLDPGAANVLYHLIDLRLKAREVPAAKPLLDAYAAGKPDTLYLRHFTLMDRCVNSSGSAGDWNTAAQSSPQALLDAALSLASAERPPVCTGAMLTALLTTDTAKVKEADNRRYFALIGRMTLLIGAGRAADAIGEVEAFYKRWGYGYSVFLYYAGLAPEFATRAMGVVATDSAANGETFTKVRAPNRFWVLGAVSLDAGHREVATAVSKELSHRADSTKAWRDVVFAQNLAARVALSTKDSSTALRMLETIAHTPVPSTALQWDEALGTALADSHLRLARLYIARGRFDDAIATADVLDSAWPTVFPAFREEALKIRRDAAQGKSEAALARRYEARLAATRDARSLASR